MVFVFAAVSCDCDVAGVSGKPLPTTGVVPAGSPVILVLTSSEGVVWRSWCRSGCDALCAAASGCLPVGLRGGLPGLANSGSFDPIWIAGAGLDDGPLVLAAVGGRGLNRFSSGACMVSLSFFGCLRNNPETVMVPTMNNKAMITHKTIRLRERKNALWRCRVLRTLKAPTLTPPPLFCGSCSVSSRFSAFKIVLTRRLSPLAHSISDR